MYPCNVAYMYYFQQNSLFAKLAVTILDQFVILTLASVLHVVNPARWIGAHAAMAGDRKSVV